MEVSRDMNVFVDVIAVVVDVPEVTSIVTRTAQKGKIHSDKRRQKKDTREEDTREGLARLHAHICIAFAL